MSSSTEEFNKRVWTMPDDQLIKLADITLRQLCRTGGSSFTMTVPPRESDCDIVMAELIRRFKELRPSVIFAYALEQGSKIDPLTLDRMNRDEDYCVHAISKMYNQFKLKLADEKQADVTGFRPVRSTAEGYISGVDAATFASQVLKRWHVIMLNGRQEMIIIKITRGSSGVEDTVIRVRPFTRSTWGIVTWWRKLVIKVKVYLKIIK